MKIVRYGIRLENLTEQSAEMVRQWRNDDKIRQHMFYTEEITEEQQLTWFKGIDNINNFYFFIYSNNKPVGVIDIAAINWSRKTAQSGLYIYEDACIGTDVPVRASLAMLDVFFLLLGINKVYAKVKGDNKVAHAYNTSLGFVQVNEIEGGFEYELSKEAYLQKTKQLRDALMKLNGKGTTISLQTSHKTDKWVQEQLHWADKVADIDLQVVVGF